MPSRPRVVSDQPKPEKPVRDYPKPALVLKTPRELAEMVGPDTLVKVSQVWLRQIAAERGAAEMREKL